MKDRDEYPWTPIADASSTLFGWTVIIIATILAGFLLGYWIGHREFTPWNQSFGAMAYLPMLWLGSPEVLVAYIVTAFAWYLPMHHETLRIRIIAALVNFAVWLIAIIMVVERTKHAKFFQF